MKSKSESKPASKSGKGASAGKRTKRALSKEESGGLRMLFVAELKDLYWAEKALTKALPKMAKKATSPDLVEAIQSHLTETEEHVSRLEKVFEAIGEKAVAHKCEAMEGLIKEGEEMAEEMPEGVVRDAAIIASAQKVEHYEISAYGTLCAFADVLGETEAIPFLESTLAEEKTADQTLNEIALMHVNEEAAALDEDMDEAAE